MKVWHHCEVSKLNKVVYFAAIAFRNRFSNSYSRFNSKDEFTLFRTLEVQRLTIDHCNPFSHLFLNYSEMVFIFRCNE